MTNPGISFESTFTTIRDRGRKTNYIPITHSNGDGGLDREKGDRAFALKTSEFFKNRRFEENVGI